MTRRDGNVENVIKGSGINGHVHLTAKNGRVFEPDDIDAKWVAQIGFDQVSGRYKLNRMMNAKRGDHSTLQFREYRKCANGLVNGLNMQLGV